MSAAKPVDLELKKAFVDLQRKMQETTHRLKYADAQIQGLKLTKGLTVSTLKELNTFPADTNVYESVGRMFLQTEMSEMVKRLKEKASNCDDKVKSLEKNKEYLEKSLKDAENNLRETVQQKLS